MLSSPSSLRRFVASSLLLLSLASSARAASLESDVAGILRDKFLDKVTVGVHLVHLGSASRDLYRHNGDTPLMPASNQKVLTTSAILDKLGADFRYRTCLAQRGRDLVLIGDGDPTFGDAELLRKLGWDIVTVFTKWAEQLKASSFAGFDNLLVDDSVFDQVFTHPSWDPRQLHNRYCAPVAGMTLNTGCVEFHVHPKGMGAPVTWTTKPATRYITVTSSCVGGKDNAIVLDRQKETNTVILKGTCPPRFEGILHLPIHDPALYAGTVLSESLQAAGIPMTGKVQRDTTARAALATGSKDLRILAVHETALPQALARANKDSSNPYAESLCKRVGYAASGQSGSWKNGPAAISAFLEKAGASPKQFHIDDGCGLSRENRVSADAMIRVLDYNFRSPNRDVFIASLAVGGHDGTLDDRFKTTDLRGRVFAKTGFINNVSALSGYLKAKDGQWYAFSILMNGIPRGTNSKAKQIQEAIVKALDSHARPAK